MNARRVILQAACVSVGALVAVSALSARPNGQSTQGQAANNQPNVAQPAVSTPVTGQGTKIRPGRTGGVMNKASAKPVQRTAGKPAQPTTMPVSAPAAGGGAFTIPSNPSSNQPQNAPQAQNMSAPQPTGQPFQANPQMNQNLDKWVNAVKPNEHHKQLEAFDVT